jgi:hypothetical protein
MIPMGRRELFLICVVWACGGCGRGGITEPTPLLASTPQHVEFGTVLTGSVTWQEVTLTNSGNADVELQAIFLQPDARGA